MLIRCLSLALLSLRFCCASLNLPQAQPVLGFGLTNAFPGISFDHPVVIASPPGETNRLFVGEKHGRIMVVNDLAHPTASVFLDLTQSTWFSEESGLLGLAFHPNYQENGRFFVFKISLPDARDELLEFKCDPPSASAADPNSQITLISQMDDSDTHNAGDLKFGADGYLYLSLGDETPPLADAHDSPQAIDKGFFSGIIRIDVDNKPENLAPNPHPSVQGPYRIPRDNPFIGATSFNDAPVDPTKVRTEFYAVGMRNPWRFTFDPFNGELICADVGAGAIEEIDIVEKGGNYGWPYMEGSRVNLPGALPPNLKLPVYEYPHGTGDLYTGRVVIGGVVYAGNDLPGLRGQYIFADYDSGNIWAMDLSAAEKKPIWLTSRTGTAAFGVNPADGSVLAVNHMEGRIERLTYNDPANSGVPLTLSEVNAFTNLEQLKAATNLFSYEVNTPLWSDGAIKQRWIDFTKAIGKIRFDESNPWDFPEGTVFVKHFELELTNGVPESRHRVETRVLVKTAEEIYGLTYRWGDSLTNASLVPTSGTNETFVIQDGGILRTQVWHYPSWDQCRTCHSREAGLVLGVRTDQLNRTTQIDGHVTNQLAWLAAQGLFAGSPDVKSEKLRRLAALDDPVAPMQYRVRSYLEANCVQCHQPGARSAALWDARIATPMSQAYILAPAVFYIPPMQIIAPHDTENSYLYLRAKTRSPLFAMPPLATSIIDQKFVDLTAAWINQIPDASWQSSDIGPALVEGSAEFDGQALRVSSAGAGVALNSHFFSGRTAVGASDFSAKLSSLAGDSPAAETGLMFRGALDANAPSVALLRQGDSLRFLTQSAADSQYQNIFTASATGVSHLKLLTDGQTISAWTADDQLNWRLFASADLDLGLNYLAGFAVASGGEASQFASAQFTDIHLDLVGLSAADSDGDGFSDALEACLGYDAHSPTDKPTLSYGIVDDAFQIELTRRAEPSTLSLIVELSSDLSNWTTAGDPSITQDTPDSRLTWSLPASEQQQFVRFSVVNRPVTNP